MIPEKLDGRPAASSVIHQQAPLMKDRSDQIADVLVVIEDEDPKESMTLIDSPAP